MKKILLCILFLIILRLVCAFYAPPEWWGINYLGFLNPTFVFIISGLSISFLLFWKRLPKIAWKFTNFIFNKYIIINSIIIASIFTVLFYTYSVPFPILDDGSHVVTTMFRYIVGADNFGSLWIEYLSYKLIEVFVHINRNSVPDSWHSIISVFQWVSYITGFLYVFFVFYLTNKLKYTNLFKLTLTSGFLFCGGILFYFGYIEYYAPIYLFGTLFILSGLREVGEFPLWSTIFFVISLPFYMLSIVFFPMLMTLYFLWQRMNIKYIIGIWGVIILACFIFYLSQNQTNDETFFLSWFGWSGWKIGILTAQHLYDIINILLLISPIIILLPFIFKFKGEQDFIFVLSCAVFWFVFLIPTRALLAMNFGMFVFCGMSLTLLVIFLIKKNNVILSQVVIQMLLLVIPWIYLNSLFQPSVERFKSITEVYMNLLPKPWVQQYIEKLRKCYVAAGNFNGEITCMTSAINLTNDSYEYAKLNGLLSQLKQQHIAISDTSTRQIIKILPKILKQDLMKIVRISQQDSLAIGDLGIYIIQKTYILSNHKYLNELKYYFKEFNEKRADDHK